MKSLGSIPLSWFRRSFDGRTLQFTEVAAVSIVLRLLALASPFAMQAIIDRILPYQRSESLALILVLLLSVAAFEGLLGFSSSRLGLWIGTGIGRDLGLRALRHVLHLPLATLQQWPVGQLLARIGEIDKVQSFIAYTTSGLPAQYRWTCSGAGSRAAIALGIFAWACRSKNNAWLMSAFTVSGR